MLKEDTNRKASEAETLLKKLSKLDKFENKYGVKPYREAGNLCREMYEFAETISEIKDPRNQDELLQSEMKRRVGGEAAYLEQRLSGKQYDFGSVIDILGIPSEDIESLRPWLESNKEKTEEAVERLFHSRDIEEYELPLASDVPSTRRQAEEFVGAHVQRYHKVIGKFLHSLTNVGEYIRDINAVPTSKERSEFDFLTNTLKISLPAVCYSTEDGTLQINDKELIRLYGHEGMGHALNFVITKSNNLPHFLTESSALVVSTAESVAQFYERRFLEDLKNSSETQRKLGIEHKFDGIYQEARDTEQLEDYKLRLFQYGISVLGNKDLGNPSDPDTVEKKKNLIDEVAMDKWYGISLIEKHKYSFDMQGNLNPSLVSELRYCARPVPRALDEFSNQGIRYEGKGRSLIDTTLLRGLWTPIGFVDNARLVAKGNKS
jgi:hypothetical protein